MHDNLAKALYLTRNTWSSMIIITPTQVVYARGDVHNKMEVHSDGL